MGSECRIIEVVEVNLFQYQPIFQSQNQIQVFYEFLFFLYFFYYLKSIRTNQKLQLPFHKFFFQSDFSKIVIKKKKVFFIGFLVGWFCFVLGEGLGYFFLFWKGVFVCLFYRGWVGFLRKFKSKFLTDEIFIWKTLK